MAKRKVDPASVTATAVPTGNQSLASKLDKGFPYDDWSYCLTFHIFKKLKK